MFSVFISFVFCKFHIYNRCQYIHKQNEILWAEIYFQCLWTYRIMDHEFLWNDQTSVFQLFYGIFVTSNILYGSEYWPALTNEQVLHGIDMKFFCWSIAVTRLDHIMNGHVCKWADGGNSNCKQNATVTSLVNISTSLKVMRAPWQRQLYVTNHEENDLMAT